MNIRLIVVLFLLISVTPSAFSVGLAPVDPYNLMDNVPQKFRRAGGHTPLPWPDVLDTYFNIPPFFQSMVFQNDVHQMPKMPLSIQNEKQLFSKILPSKTFDIMVVPFQSQHFSFDRITRSLIAADLAYNISKLTGKKVADTYIVSRALGEGLRKYHDIDVIKLAKKLGVKTIIWGHVGHDRNGGMKLSIITEKYIKKTANYKRLKDREYHNANIPFTNVNLPYFAYKRVLPNILKAIGQDSRLSQPATNREQNQPAFIDEVNKFLGNHAEHTYSNAELFVFLGLLGRHRHARGAERLFEKAILYIQNTKSGDRYTKKITKSLALYHLNRIPAALEILDNINTAPAKALKSIIKGNLSNAIAGYNKVDSLYFKYVLQIEIYDLANIYGSNLMDYVSLNAGKNDASNGPIRTLFDHRILDRDGWSLESNQDIKKLLDQYYPVVGASAKQIDMKQFVMKSGRDPIEIDLSVQAHVNTFVRDSDIWMNNSYTNIDPSDSDILFLLESIGQANLHKKIDYQHHIQGNVEHALKLINRYYDIYPEHPAFSAQRAEIKSHLARIAPPKHQSAYLHDAKNSALTAAYWEQGQTIYAKLALDVLGLSAKEAEPYVYSYIRDFPVRPYWPVREPGEYDLSEHPTDTNKDGSIPRHYLNQKAAMNNSQHHVKHALALSTHSSQKISNAAKRVLKERFKDHPERYSGFDKLSLGSEEQIIFLKKAVTAQPFNFIYTYHLAQAIIFHNRDFESAYKVIADYLGFTESTDNTVAVSNYAYSAAQLFDMHVQTEMAKKLYTLSSSYNNGAHSSLASAIRLQIMSEDYGRAVLGLQSIIDRYHKKEDYEAYAAILYVLQQNNIANALVIDKKDNFHEVLYASRIGNKITGMSSKSFISWLQQPHIKYKLHRKSTLAFIETIRWYIEGQRPASDLEKTLVHIEGNPSLTVGNDGVRLWLTDRLTDKPFSLEIPKTYSLAKKNPGTMLHHGYIYFARAYTALQNGDLPTANAEFKELAKHYMIIHRLNVMHFALPYIAYAQAKSGSTSLIDNILKQIGKGAQETRYYLALAYIDGLNNKHSSALSLIDKAKNYSYDTYTEPLSDRFMIADAYIRLYEDTKHEQYRRSAVKWAKDVQATQPFTSWPYAVEARYTEIKTDRVRALTRLIYLDPASQMIKHFTASDINAAKNMIKTNHPFKIKVTTHSTSTNAI